MTRGKMGWAAVAMLTLAGCASTSQPQTAAEMFDCDALNQAVASADNDFTDIKGRFDDTRLTRSWETDVQAFHDSCLITSAQRPDHYSCFGRMDSDDPRGALVAGGEALGQCLGSDWTSTRETSDRLVFSRAGSDTTVTLETFLNDRGRRMGSLDVWQHPDDLRLESTDG
ncbi:MULTISPECIES: hypothetical protein [Halomonas]|uniref:DUF3617 family protein n=2 Tax=Halomonas TaxID=2745 RepID=A0AAU7KVQ4_9GAMM|nr:MULTISPECIES: hypothetical protein [Halomonas]MBY5940190.1 hypothetical protein [Halomonas sp. DP5N14-9]MBY6109749.1 hypothetical protein [Halomonas sp. DP1Y21-3]